MYSALETRLGNKQSLRVCVKRDLSSPHPEWGQLLSLPSASHEFFLHRLGGCYSNTRGSCMITTYCVCTADLAYSSIDSKLRQSIPQRLAALVLSVPLPQAVCMLVAFHTSSSFRARNSSSSSEEVFCENLQLQGGKECTMSHKLLT